MDRDHYWTIIAESCASTDAEPEMVELLKQLNPSEVGEPLLSASSEITDTEVVDELTEDGGKIEDYFLIQDSICTVNKRGELCQLLVEDLPGEEEGKMHLASVDFLRRNGANAYNSVEDFRKQQAEQ